MGLEIRAGARSLATPISVQLVSPSVSQSVIQSVKYKVSRSVRNTERALPEFSQGFQ